MNYAYQVKKLRLQFKDFVCKWNDYLMDRLYPGQHIILKECSHIAERSYERDVDTAIVIRLVSYVLEHHMDKLKFNGDIGIAYANRLGIILSCKHILGKWQVKTEIRINTVFNSINMSTDRIIPISFETMMGYNLPKVTDGHKIIKFNFDKKLEAARQRIYNLIDAR